MNDTTATDIEDALIIGAGPAGLSTALGLARQLFTAVVFDHQQYRNAAANRMHNVVTWDHRPPQEFRDAARANLLSRYDTIRFQHTRVQNVTKLEDGLFEVGDGGQNVYRGRTLVLAQGITDIYPSIDGYAECWGNAIFHCLFCHGFEESGSSSAGVLAVGMLSKPAMTLHVARMANRLAEDITVYTNGDETVTTSMQEEIGTKPLTIEPRKIARFERNSGRSGLTVHFIDGASKQEGFLAHMPEAQINGPFVGQLGVELTEQGFIKTNPPFNETTISGVFAVGDCATQLRAVTQAIAMGSCSAAGMAARLTALGKLA